MSSSKKIPLLTPALLKTKYDGPALVTPENAKILLARNNFYNEKIGRHPRRSNMQTLHDNVADGGWNENCILQFHEDGSIISAQHRLMFIVETGMPRVCRVMTKQTDADRDAADTCRPKTLDERVCFSSDIKKSKMISKVCTAIGRCRWPHSDRVTPRRTEHLVSTYPEIRQVVELFGKWLGKKSEKNGKPETAAEKRLQVLTPHLKPTTLAAFAEALRIDVKFLDFLKDYMYQSPKNEIVSALKERLLQDSQKGRFGGSYQKDTFHMTICAMDRWYRGDERTTHFRKDSEWSDDVKPADRHVDWTKPAPVNVELKKAVPQNGKHKNVPRIAAKKSKH